MNHGFAADLYNEELAPIAPEKRSWSWLNMATVWMGMVHNIVAYEAAAGLMALGLSAWECLAVVGVAYCILFVTMWLNAKAGTRYGVPFCVLIRSAFGPKGAQIPVILRGFCAIFWFSVQAYVATQAMDAILSTLSTTWASFTTPVLGMSEKRWASMLIVWALHIWISSHGVHRIKNFELVAGPLVILVGLMATLWGLHVGHGVGPLFAVPSRLHGFAFVSAFALGVTGIIGIWATFAVNIPDLSRFVRSQRDQVIGQAIGLPLTALVFTPMAIITTSATVLLFGHPIWDPTELLLMLHHNVITVFGGATIILATLSVNVVANILPASYDLINIFPKYLNYNRASVLVIISGVFFMPWLWFDHSGSIYTMLNLIGGALGPVTGIMLADYYVIRRQSIIVPEFYRHSGVYDGNKGWGFPAIIVTCLGTLVDALGQTVPELSYIGRISWFIGVFIGFGMYILLTVTKKK